MHILGVILITIFYLFSPLGILFLCDKYPFINKIGAVLTAYIIGVFLSLTGLLQSELIQLLQDMLMLITIPLAIPLLLFSSDFKNALSLAKGTFISLFVALLSVVIMVIIGFIVLKSEMSNDFFKVGAMLIGVYSGGTPNLAALKMVLDVKEDTYLFIHTYDMLLSTFHLFFLMSVGKKVFGWILPNFSYLNEGLRTDMEYETKHLPFWGLLGKEKRIPLLKALLLALAVVLIGAVFMFFVEEKSKMAVFVLTITSLGILSSFHKKIKNTPKTFELGMYLILVFSVVVASKVKLSDFTNIYTELFYYIGFVLFGSLTLHVILSRFFKIDADTVIITSTALICSPPFVPVVAGAINNRQIILPGITVGIIGYAIGNYLGYMMSIVLQYL
jgi:uncharacterized membrane protein